MSSSCCGEDEPKNSKKHDDDHDHSHGAGEFDFKKEVIPVVVVTALLLMGSIYNQPLHNTPYAFAEYLILIPAYLLSGWNVLSIAGKNILKGRFFDDHCHIRGDRYSSITRSCRCDAVF
jgi:Cd2+/Zn2+-exporting ATPase